MFCKNCGKKIDADSLFCHFCGEKVKEITPEKSQTHVEQKRKTSKNNLDSKLDNDILWNKFAQVYDAENEEKEKYNNLSSEFIWELLERLSVNRFESFLEENKTELNSQPYKTIEALKNTFIWSAIGGYRLWLAEALIKNNEVLSQFKSFSLEDFIEAWKEYDFEKAYKKLSDPLSICLTKYSSFRLNNFIEIAPEAKEISNATIENLRSALILHIVNGYHAGKVENNFRK